MYAYSISAAGATFNNTRAEVLHASEAAVEIAHWRKFNNLHGWMERLYRKKGGDREFNCVNVPLTKDDLATLEKDVAARNLPPEAGFFFGGQDELTDEDATDIRLFIAKALTHLEQGRVVYYTSWW